MLPSQHAMYTSVGIMLGQRQRRWATIDLTFFVYQDIDLLRWGDNELNVVMNGFGSRTRRFERNKNVSSPSTCESQYCGEPP